VTLCEKDLNSKSTLDEPLYSKITTTDLERAKSKIKETIDKANKDQQISNKEYKELLPTEKNPGKFYQIFKVH
jgi:hypothetical protein